jgi:hypothetical protein
MGKVFFDRGPIGFSYFILDSASNFTLKGPSAAPGSRSGANLRGQNEEPKWCTDITLGAVGDIGAVGEMKKNGSVRRSELFGLY